ncbi:MAG: hypothetical protein CL833_05105 [Crocinitomicaceae bacterium]|nr:hypothetical protein [Crocinitomicaceae bacterium]
MTKKRKTVKAKPAQTVKSELTEVEKFYVEQKCRDGVSLEEIQSVIKPVALVEQVYKQTAAEMQETSKPKASDMFGRNERYGAVVMTQNASEFGDNNKKPVASNNSETKAPHIHKFR